MPYFDLNDLQGWDVRNGNSSKSYDAWEGALEKSYGYEAKFDVRNDESGGGATASGEEKRERKRSVDSGMSLTVYYLDLTQEVIF